MKKFEDLQTAVVESRQCYTMYLKNTIMDQGFHPLQDVILVSL